MKTSPVPRREIKDEELMTEVSESARRRPPTQIPTHPDPRASPHHRTQPADSSMIQAQPNYRATPISHQFNTPTHHYFPRRKHPGQRRSRTNSGDRCQSPAVRPDASTKKI